MSRQGQAVAVVATAQQVKPQQARQQDLPPTLQDPTVAQAHNLPLMAPCAGSAEVVAEEAEGMPEFMTTC